MCVENGVRVLYVRLLIAIYGCVQSALLWYQLFYSRLEDMGFKLNQYNPCVVNKEINGKQCTIVWYVDDTKISHVDPDVVTNVIEQIEERFGNMTVTRGREHVSLGMKNAFKESGTTAEILMRDYLEEAIAESGLDIVDTKISHVDPDVVTNVIKQIEESFGNMTVTRGREHVSLGMKIAFKESGTTAEILMRDYLEEAIAESELDTIVQTAATPARRNLFEIDANARCLEKKEAEVFIALSPSSCTCRFEPDLIFC